MKKFSKFEIAVIKRTAQNVNPIVTKKNKIKEQLKTLQQEYENLEKIQDSYEESIKVMTGGYGTEDLVTKVVENTGKVNKDGNEIKVTKYVLKYPETIIPVFDETEEVIPIEEDCYFNEEDSENNNF